ncbi:hypothetical protein BGW41_007540, partial [Actinomortierella wolfii]
VGRRCDDWFLRNISKFQDILASLEHKDSTNPKKDSERWIIPPFKQRSRSDVDVTSPSKNVPWTHST